MDESDRRDPERMRRVTSFRCQHVNGCDAVAPGVGILLRHLDRARGVTRLMAYRMIADSPSHYLHTSGRGMGLVPARATEKTVLRSNSQPAEVRPVTVMPRL